MGQSTVGERLKRASAHDNRVVRGQLFEAFEVGFEGIKQLVLIADGPVLGYGSYERVSFEYGGWFFRKVRTLDFPRLWKEDVGPTAQVLGETERISAISNQYNATRTAFRKRDGFSA